MQANGHFYARIAGQLAILRAWRMPRCVLGLRLARRASSRPERNHPEYPRPGGLRQPARGSRMAEAIPALEIRNLHKRYGDLDEHDGW